MLDLGKPGEMRAATAQQFRKAADAIVIAMRQEGPFWGKCAEGNAPETDADIFAQLFRGSEPRSDRIGCFGRHGVRLDFGEVAQQAQFQVDAHNALLEFKGGSQINRVVQRIVLSVGQRDGCACDLSIAVGKVVAHCPIPAFPATTEPDAS